MQDFNIIERSQNKGSLNHTRFSSIVKSSTVKVPLQQTPQPTQADEKSVEI
jgi:hypothetical protein